MTSIPSEKLARIADATAFESRRPWRVKDLRARALEAYLAGMRRSARSGLSGEKVSVRVRQGIKEQVLQTGKELDALPPDQSKPTPDQIETALEAFSTEQWIDLIDGLDPSGTSALLSHIRQNSDELKQRPTARKIERIEVRAIMRDTDLWLVENRDELVPISDVFWAVAFRDLAREANRTGKGHAANGRSVAEQSSDRSIARRLTKRDEQTGRVMKVSRDEVKTWRERMERLPYDKFAADKPDDEVTSGAALVEYLTMIRKKYQREN